MGGRPRGVNRKAKRSTPRRLLISYRSVISRLICATAIVVGVGAVSSRGRDTTSPAPAWSRISHRFADKVRQNDVKIDVDATPRRQPLSGTPAIIRGTVERAEAW